MRLVRYAHWSSGAAFEFLPVVGRHESQRFISEVREALGEWFDRSMLPRYFETYLRPEGAIDWVAQAVAARGAVERSLGVNVQDHRVSRVWFGPLVGELLANARRFADAHNRALADYRRRYRVRAARMPVPDLHEDADRCEVAMWAYQPGLPRRHLFVRPAGELLELLADDVPIGTVPVAHLSRWELLKEDMADLAPWCLRPRALTLTLWARLFLADLFIHGIGGAKYDRVTDDIIRHYFGVEPPGMACVSATLCMDLPAQRVCPGEVTEMRRRLRDLQYNPQRYAGGSARREVEARARAVARSVWLREHDRRNRPARREVFGEIRNWNDRISEAIPEVHGELTARLDEIQRRAADNAVARNREWFFAALPREALELLLERLPGVQDFAPHGIVTS
jgi:hypothetical protein